MGKQRRADDGDTGGSAKKEATQQQSLTSAPDKGVREASLKRSTDLLDLAPVAYFIFGRDGTILQSNLRGASLLGCPTARLQREKFGTFVSTESLPVFDAFLQRVFAGRNENTCEMTLLPTHQRPQLAVQIEAAIDTTGQTCSAVVLDITERKRMEATLRQSEERWKFALEGTGDGVWDWNVRTGELAYSTRWKEMLGHTDEEIPDLPEEWFKRVHPDDLPIAGANQKNLLDGKTTTTSIELRMRCKDGSWKWILARGMVVSRDASGKPLRIVGTNSDISERRFMEAALRQNEERWTLALEAAGLGVWDSNLLTGETTYSKRWKDILGFTENEIGNTSSEWMTRIHPEDMPSVIECYQQVLDLKKPSDSIEFRMLCKDGRWKWIYGTGMLVGRDANGKPLRIIGTNSDIDQRKQIEENLCMTMIELEERRREAQSLAETKSHFLNAASHDLRQPLYAAQLFADAIDGEELTPQQQDAMQKLRLSINAISEQLQALLDVSRLDMGNIQPQLREISVADIFHNLEVTYVPIAKQAHVFLRFSKGRGHVHSDPVLLTRLLGNLVDNAIKFSRRGAILVCVRRCAQGMRIEVRDNGPGIPPEHQQRIFDEYYQIDNLARNPSAGFGLGLSIALRISRLLNIGFALRTQVGRGSVFSITFPAELPTSDQAGEG